MTTLSIATAVAGSSGVFYIANSKEGIVLSLFLGCYALGKTLEQVSNQETLGFTTRAYKEAFVGTKLSTPLFVRAVTHEMLHLLAKRKIIRYDLPFASAFGILSENPLSNLNYDYGYKIAETYPNPKKRWERLLDLSPDQDPRIYFASTRQIFTEEEARFYTLGGKLAGVANYLSITKWRNSKYAKIYLGRLAQGEDPFKVEQDIDKEASGENRVHRAQNSAASEKNPFDNAAQGGIDLNPSKINLETKDNGGAIKFNLDPAMLQRMQNASGVTPVIVGISSLGSLQQFMGVPDPVIK
jgi:hypothetical protein